ncbi:hypothetical protein [Paenibacillus sp. CFBP13512]|uniref:hypothetical protein n=1 Tax=Paenibacillus sp. CFBP13512 TaxID=2184007 RepID=UPI001375D477|nr:hypothetical protein [Paenibacillus sp. CFBP13512]
MKHNEENEKQRQQEYQLISMNISFFKQLFAQPRKYGGRHENPILLSPKNQ